MPLQGLFRSRASAAESTRKALVERQLVSLQKNLPMATHRDAERRHWEVGIQLHSMQILVLQILLPADFPTSAPTIQLTTPCIHPWLAQDGKTIVGHPQLAQWQSHFDLGRIALEVISKMETTPPTPLLEQSSGSGGVAAPARVEQALPAKYPHRGHEIHPHQHQAHPSEAGRVVQPEPRTHVEVPAVFPAIESASIDGLLFMNGDTPDSKKSRELFIQKHEFVSNRVQRRRELRRGCQILAQRNMEAGSHIRHLQEEVRGLDARVDERMEQLQASLAHQRRLAEQFSEEAALQTLEARKHQMDELSMQTTDRFLEDPTADDESFCREFLAQRQAFHEANGTFERLRTEVSATHGR